jgi:hypothetical protein
LPLFVDWVPPSSLLDAELEPFSFWPLVAPPLEDEEVDPEPELLPVDPVTAAPGIEVFEEEPSAPAPAATLGFETLEAVRVFSVRELVPVPAESNELEPVPAAPAPVAVAPVPALDTLEDVRPV